MNQDGLKSPPVSSDTRSMRPDRLVQFTLALALGSAFFGAAANADSKIPEWIRRDQPVLYKAVVRALGEDEAAKFFEGWQPSDLTPFSQKIDDFRRHIIENIFDPKQARGVPRSYALDVFGLIGEELGLAEFRRTQPADARVLGEIGKRSSDTGSLRRPDGISFRVDPKTRRLTILGLLESKIAKSSSGGYDPEQYHEMLEQWKERGIAIGHDVFDPQHIELNLGGRIKPLSEAVGSDFDHIVSLYQPSYKAGTRSASVGVAKVLEPRIDPWKMRYAGFSIISEALHPLIEDEFPAYMRDMEELTRLYRSAGRDDPPTARMIEILKKYDAEHIDAGVSTLAPDLLNHVRTEHGDIHGRMGTSEAKKSVQAVKEAYSAWKSGKREINDPVERTLLRLKFETNDVFADFLRVNRRWPKRQDLTGATHSADAVARIIEDRFAADVESAGGPTIYLTRMPQDVVKDFVLHTDWKPSAQELLEFLSDPHLSEEKRRTYFKIFTGVYGPKGWATRPGEPPAFGIPYEQVLHQFCDRSYSAL